MEGPPVCWAQPWLVSRLAARHRRSLVAPDQSHVTIMHERERGSNWWTLQHFIFHNVPTLYFLMSVSVLRYLSSVAVSAGQLARHHQAQQLKCTHIQLWFANILKTALYLKSLQTSVQMSGLCLFSLVYKYLWKCSLCKTSRRFVDSSIS